MIILLSIVALLEFAWIIYQDIKFSRERERYHLKLMSDDVTEYKTALESEPIDTVEEKDPYKDIQDVSTDELLAAKDLL